MLAHLGPHQKLQLLGLWFFTTDLKVSKTINICSLAGLAQNMEMSGRFESRLNLIEGTFLCNIIEIYKKNK